MLLLLLLVGPLRLLDGTCLRVSGRSWGVFDSFSEDMALRLSEFAFDLAGVLSLREGSAGVFSLRRGSAGVAFLWELLVDVRELLARGASAFAFSLRVLGVSSGSFISFARSAAFLNSFVSSVSESWP